MELDKNGDNARERECKSQQLRRVKTEDSHPLIIQAKPSMNVDLESPDGAINLIVTETRNEPSESCQSINPPEAGNVLPSASSNHSSDGFTSHVDDRSTEEEVEIIQADEPTEDENDADLALVEDFAFVAEDAIDDDGDEVNFLAMGQAVKVNDDKHKQKWDKYLVERQKLVKDKYTVRCKPPRQQGINIGVHVQESSGEKRKGLVISSNRDETQDSAPPCWVILIDETGELLHNVPSTALAVIQDKQIYEWKTIKDSFCDRPVHPYQKHGIVGFDFSAFDEAKLNVNNADYDFPHLRLLIHLWPGNWQEQLSNLNVHIEDVHRSLPKTKRTPLVSEFEWWAFWGCIFAACPAGEAGEAPFHESKIRKLVWSLNLGRHGINALSWSRFKAIRQYMPFCIL